jgi:hypothetical protein
MQFLIVSMMSVAKLPITSSLLVEFPFVGVGDSSAGCSCCQGPGSQPRARLASVKNSVLWSKFTILSLNTPIRSASDPQYTSFVDQIGEDFSHTHASFTCSNL